MMENGKKRNYYRLALCEGRRRRMELTEDYRLTGRGGGAFLYLAPVYDSMDLQGTWHRLVLEGEFVHCKYEILAAATDADRAGEMEEVWEQGAAPESVWQQDASVRRVNTGDLLLHGLTGRYLWVLIRVWGAGEDSHFRIEGFRVEFPWRSFTDYLPEIYQGERDSFFERYMTGLQSVYEDLEEQAERIPEYLDYESTPDENLPVLARWTGDWAAGRDYRTEQLRRMFGRLNRLNSGRGTAGVLREMIKFVTGRDAVLVEYFKWHDWMKRNTEQLALYGRLYGEHEDRFTVILDVTDGGVEMERQALEKLVADYTPFGMQPGLVLLTWSSHMDTHCYLDRNSRLSMPEQAGTDGFALDGSYMLG